MSESTHNVHAKHVAIEVLIEHLQTGHGLLLNPGDVANIMVEKQARHYHAQAHRHGNKRRTGCQYHDVSWRGCDYCPAVEETT